MFVLAVTLSANSVTLMKSELRRTLPEVKSSHRCEALARGLGFRTYASLLASEEGSVATADGAAFAGYLESHAFGVGTRPFYDAVARQALLGVHDAVTRLSAFGYGAGEPQYGEGRWETSSEHWSRHLEDRAELLDVGSVQPFLASLCLLKRIPAMRTIRSDSGSYRLKHIAENFRCNYPGGERLGPVYVPNGVFIAAAIHAGFLFKTHVTLRGYEHPNVTFNMPKRIVDELDAEIRSRGAVDRMREESSPVASI